MKRIIISFFQKSMPSKREARVLSATRRSLFFGIIFLLSCTHPPSSELDLSSGEGELLRIEGMEKQEVQKRFAEKGVAVRVLEADQTETTLILIRRSDGDSLPTPLRQLQKEASTKEVKPSSIDLPGRRSGPSDLTKSEPSSGMDLPYIFDIFTRIY